MRLKKKKKNRKHQFPMADGALKEYTKERTAKEITTGSCGEDVTWTFDDTTGIP